MKKLVLVLLLSGSLLSALYAAGATESQDSDYVLLDQSEENPVLIIGSIDVLTSAFGAKVGPQSLSFVKVQPSIGQRFIPKRDDRLFGDSRVFYFDSVSLGEVYKLYDLVWTVSVDKELLTYRAGPGVAGTDLQFKVVNPGIYYVGAFTFRQQISGDFEMSESHVLESVLPHLDATPQWKALVQARIAELAVQKESK